MESAELISAMGRKLINDLARHLNRIVAAFDIDLDSIPPDRIILCQMLVLELSQPACFHKSDPTIVTKDSADECFHFIGHGLGCPIFGINDTQDSICLVDLHS